MTKQISIARIRRIVMSMALIFWFALRIANHEPIAIELRQSVASKGFGGIQQIRGK